VYLQEAEGLLYTRLWILLANLVLIAIVLLIVAKRPVKVKNKRVPVANSRYNPQFDAELAAEAAAEGA
jgi:hypothetical protein